MYVEFYALSLPYGGRKAIGYANDVILIVNGAHVAGALEGVRVAL